MSVTPEQALDMWEARMNSFDPMTNAGHDIADLHDEWRAMGAFEKWRKEYGDRMHAEGRVRNPTDEEAFRAGMRAAAEIAKLRVLNLSNDEILRAAIGDILAEADK